MSEQAIGHSAEYFGESRNYWWNDDFLALLARRWELGEVRSLLDVGCGVGHWGRALAPYLAADAEIVGVDREPCWVEEAPRRTLRSGLRYRAIQGDATALPMADATFDAVTCQTVLIHVHDANAAIREMLRVVRPGGLIVLVEPNNRCSSLATSSHRFGADIEELLALVRFQLVCERGKAALGEGDNSIGELVPGMLAAAGACDVRVCLSDKAYAFVPPYVTADERARRSETTAWAQREFWIWDRMDTRRYFIAGGGNPTTFDALWTRALADVRAVADGLSSGVLHGGGGCVTYVTWGRRPR